MTENIKHDTSVSDFNTLLRDLSEDFEKKYCKAIDTSSANVLINY